MGVCLLSLLWKRYSYIAKTFAYLWITVADTYIVGFSIWLMHAVTRLWHLLLVHCLRLSTVSEAEDSNNNNYVKGIVHESSPKHVYHELCNSFFFILLVFWIFINSWASTTFSIHSQKFNQLKILEIYIYIQMFHSANQFDLIFRYSSNS